MQRSRESTGGRKGKAEEGALRDLPAVSTVLEGAAMRPLIRDYGAALVTDFVRELLEAIRSEVRAGELAGDALRDRVRPENLTRAVAERATALLAPRPRTVVNATGIVVHTNLGRSTLSPRAAARVAEMARGYIDLEYDVQRGARGSRLSLLEPLMSRLFPGHGFTVVNNNAAAILLCLRALGRGREVVISRGELVEIGGSFRVPDILEASGAGLVEVGTTNRTRTADYAAALTERSALILKVHTSNFKIVGFTEEPTLASLAALARERGVPLVVDWGSGDLVDLGPLGIHDELPVSEVLQAGADLVTFSGDKLLGGPQAGFVVGRPDLVARLRSDPMSRVCRLDRLLLGALHETLSAYVRGRSLHDVPTLSMLALTPQEIDVRATALRERVSAATGHGERISVIDGISRTGGGSSPTGERPTRLLAVRSARGDAGALESHLRLGDPPIVGRVQEGTLLLDLRTVLPAQDEIVAERLAEALRAESTRG